MDKLMDELTKFIEKTRKDNQDQPFLSDFENGCNYGRTDVADDLERLIQKFK